MNFSSGQGQSSRSRPCRRRRLSLRWVGQVVSVLCLLGGMASSAAGQKPTSAPPTATVPVPGQVTTVPVAGEGEREPTQAAPDVEADSAGQQARDAGGAADSGQPAPSAPPIYPGLEVPPATVAHGGGWNPWDHPEAGGAHTHDGFFLRMALGLGGSALRGQRDPETRDGVVFSGFGLTGSIAVGGSLAENLMLHGDLFFASMVDAEVDGGIYDGAAREFGYGYDGDVSYLAPGIGVTYFLMPTNLYLSAAVGLANAVWERSDGERQASRLGLAVNLLCGKEWWVDPQWGIGAALQVMLMRAGDYHYGDVRALTLALLFSATHN